MKKGFKFLFLFLSVLTLGLVLVACSKHEHTFASEWTFNASEHWHKATCEHTDEVSDKAAHTFGGWQVRTAPTETSEGVEFRTCSVCGYEETRSVEKTPHTHTFSDTWSSNETKHWHASTCGHADVVSDEADHTWGDWTVVTEAGYLTKGSRKHTCTVCGKEVVEEIPARTYMTSAEFKTNVIDTLNVSSGKVSLSFTEGTNSGSGYGLFKNNVLDVFDGETHSYFFIKEEHLYGLILENGTEDVYLQKDLTGEDSLLANTLINGIEVSAVVKFLSSSYESTDDIVTMFEADKVTFTWNAEKSQYDITRTGGPATVAAADELVRAHEISELQKVAFLFNSVKLTDEGVTFTASYPDESYSFVMTFAANNSDVALPEKIYSAEWSKDEEGHFHAPLFDEGEAKHSLGAHTYGEMIVDTEPYVDDQGEEQDGVGHKICTVCGHVLENQVVAHPAHEHNWGEWTVVIKPTYTSLGSYERVCTKNSKHVEKVSLPVLTDSNYTITRKIEDNKVVDAISITIKDADGNDLAVTFTKEYTITASKEIADDAIYAVKGLYAKHDDLVFFTDDLQDNNATCELTDLAYNGILKSYDEVVLLVQKTAAKKLKVIAVVQVSHPEYALTVNGDVTTTVNGEAKPAKLTNASEYKFNFVSTDTAKVIARVKLTMLGNETELTANANGEYVVIAEGPVAINVETVTVYTELTDISQLADVSEYDYKVLIVASWSETKKVEEQDVTTVYTYMLDGASSNIGGYDNYVAIDKVEFLNGAIISNTEVDAAAFDLSLVDGKYALLTSTGKFIGRNSGNTNSLNTYNYPYANEIAITDGVTTVKSSDCFLSFNKNLGSGDNASKITGFRYYGNQNQKAIKVYLLKGAQYTAEEKKAKAENVLNMVATSVFGISETPTTLKYSRNYTLPLGVTAVVKSSSVDNVASVADGIVSVKPAIADATISVVLTLSFAGETKDITLSIVNLTATTVTNALTAINESTFKGDGSATVTGDAFYQITGVITNVSSKDSSDKYSITIKDPDDSTKTIIVYSSTNKNLFENNTITVSGNLCYYKPTSGDAVERIVNISILNNNPAQATLSFVVDPDSLDEKVTITDNANNQVVLMPIQGYNGDKVEFKVTVADGFKLSSVMNGTKEIKDTNGIYSVTLINNQTITINVTEPINYSAYTKVNSADELQDGMDITFVYETKGVVVNGASTNTLTSTKGVVFENTLFGAEGVKTLKLTKVEGKDNKWYLSYDFGGNEGVKYFAPDAEASEFGTAKWQTEGYEWELNENMYFVASENNKNFMIKTNETKISTYNPTASQKNVSIYVLSNSISKSALEKYVQSLADASASKLSTDMSSAKKDDEVQLTNNAVLTSLIEGSTQLIDQNNGNISEGSYLTIATGKNSITYSNLNTTVEDGVEVTFIVRVVLSYGTKPEEKIEKTKTASFTLEKQNASKVEYAYLKNISNTNFDSSGGEVTKTYLADGSGKQYFKDAKTAGDLSQFKLVNTTAYNITSTATTLKLDIVLGGGTDNTDAGYTTVTLLDISGNKIEGTTINITNSYKAATKDYTVSWTLTESLKTGVYGLVIEHTRISGYNTRLYSFSLYTE